MSFTPELEASLDEVETKGSKNQIELFPPPKVELSMIIEDGESQGSNSQTPPKPSPLFTTSSTPRYNKGRDYSPSHRGSSPISEAEAEEMSLRAELDSPTYQDSKTEERTYISELEPVTPQSNTSSNQKTEGVDLGTENEYTTMVK